MQTSLDTTSGAPSSSASLDNLSPLIGAAAVIEQHLAEYLRVPVSPGDPDFLSRLNSSALVLFRLTAIRKTLVMTRAFIDGRNNPPLSKADREWEEEQLLHERAGREIDRRLDEFEASPEGIQAAAEDRVYQVECAVKMLEIAKAALADAEKKWSAARSGEFNESPASIKSSAKELEIAKSKLAAAEKKLWATQAALRDGKEWYDYIDDDDEEEDYEDDESQNTDGFTDGWRLHIPPSSTPSTQSTQSTGSTQSTRYTPSDQSDWSDSSAPSRQTPSFPPLRPLSPLAQTPPRAELRTGLRAANAPSPSSSPSVRAVPVCPTLSLDNLPETLDSTARLLVPAPGNDPAAPLPPTIPPREHPTSKSKPSSAPPALSAVKTSSSSSPKSQIPNPPSKPPPDP